MPEIANENLTLEDIPSPQADWQEVERFALSFAGYESGFDECAEIANSQRHDSLDDLRTCLFFEQRRWRHFGQGPSQEAMSYVSELVEMIRSRVAAGEHRAVVPPKEAVMGKIRSFNLSPGTRVGNYRIIENIGRGWEGEVYKVAEVPTEAIRALKLFRTDGLESIRHLTAYAWYYEQVRDSGSVPVYYHYGQWFLDDDNGCWYLVFEYIHGKSLASLEATEELFLKVAKAMSRVHAFGYGVGDLSTLANVVVRSRDGEPTFVDCNPGVPDKPNEDFRSDCIEELPGVAKAMFQSQVPSRVAALLKHLKAQKRFSKNTLSTALAKVLGPAEGQH